MPKKSNESTNADLVQLAIEGIDAKINELTAKRQELVQMLGHGPATKQKRESATSKKEAKEAKEAGDAPAKKRVFSAATRRKLREAAQARWKRQREQQQAE